MRFNAFVEDCREKDDANYQTTAFLLMQLKQGLLPKGQSGADTVATPTVSPGIEQQQQQQQTCT